MFTDDMIFSLLNYIRENEEITDLRLFVSSHFSLDWRTEAANFIKYVRDTKSYIYRKGDSEGYYLTDDGKRFLKMEERKKKNDKIVKKLKWLIHFIIIPIVIGSIPLGIYIYDMYNKPKIHLLYNNKDIKNIDTLTFELKKYPQQKRIESIVELQFLNLGSKRAENIKSYLYLDKGRIEYADQYYFSNINELKSEKKNFKKKYQSNPFLNNLSLDPKESYFIDFLYINNDGNKDDVKAIITIFYGQPEETEYYFTIRFKK